MITQEYHELSKHGWRLSAMEYGDVLRPVSSAFAITLHFEEGRAYGASSCNRYFSNYRIQESQLRFQAIGSTRMMCSEAAMMLEGEYLVALAHVETYQIQGDQLTLFYGQDKDKMLFVHEE